MTFQGWTNQIISEVGGPELTLHYRNPILALASLFSSPKNSDGFKEVFELVKNNDGERMYTTPNTCKWWETMEVRIAYFKVQINQYFWNFYFIQ